ncbi:hypothetical protein BDQ17DRAFT_1177684, partial [Cyathus striatus]
HESVENGFHLEHRTIHHTHPDMTNTISKLCNHMDRNEVHIFKPGRKADISIPDRISVAMDIILHQQETVCVDEQET